MALTQVKGSILSDELYRRENNLSDVPDKAIARNNLSVYAKSETYTKNESGSLYLNESNNLSDLDNKSTARANLDVYSKGEINNKIDVIPPSIWVGEIRRFSFDTPPPGFFALDGSTITNGKNDFPELASSGSRFITISGNNIVLKNFVDFGRGKGSSGRAVGASESDAIRNIIGSFDGGVSYTSSTSSGVFRITMTGSKFGGSSGSSLLRNKLDLNTSNVVPTAPENRPKSLTELVCIYHGVI